VLFLWVYGPVTCDEVAVKVCQAGAERWLHLEGEGLHSLRHENILAIMGYVPLSCPRYHMAGGLVLEKCDCSLHELLLEGPLSDGQRWDIAAQLLSALVHAHEAGYSHNDLKPANILVKRAEGIVKVADWGLVLRMGETFCGMRGTPGYACPEIETLTPHESATSRAVHDTWGFGRVMLDLASDYRRSLTLSEPEVLCDARFLGIARWCLTADPSSRPTLAQVQRHLMGCATFPVCTVSIAAILATS
jgi:serine/threonine protein kinase